MVPQTALPFRQEQKVEMISFPNYTHIQTKTHAYQQKQNNSKRSSILCTSVLMHFRPLDRIKILKHKKIFTQSNDAKYTSSEVHQFLSIEDLRGFKHTCLVRVSRAKVCSWEARRPRTSLSSAASDTTFRRKFCFFSLRSFSNGSTSLGLSELVDITSL